VMQLLDRVKPLSLWIPAELPTDARVLAYSRFFLGGPQDSTYEARLNDFHEKLKSRATTEIHEVKQFVTTLSAQLDSTQSQFQTIKKLPIKGGIGKKEWETFSRQWGQLEGQLNQVLSKWTAESIRNEYFYGQLYELVQQIGREIDNYHGAQDQYFLTGIIEADLEKKYQIAANLLTELKEKIAQLEKLSPSPKGMPPRLK
jgi:chromosome segregation ATPase